MMKFGESKKTFLGTNFFNFFNFFCSKNLQGFDFANDGMHDDKMKCGKSLSIMSNVKNFELWENFPNLEMAADLIGEAAFAILDGIQG